MRFVWPIVVGLGLIVGVALCAGGTVIERCAVPGFPPSCASVWRP